VLDAVTRRQWRMLVVILSMALAVPLTFFRSSSAQGAASAKPRYRAEVVASSATGENRAAALEALLNKRAEDGYEIFDIDRDATGNTLVVFQLARK